MQLLKRHPIVFVTMTFLLVLSFLVACESGEVVPSPSISGIKPDTGPVGTEVTITGTNLGTDGVYATISFGSQPATAISSAASSGKITVQVPSLNPGVYQVSAKLGERSPSGPVKFTVTPTTPDQFDALAPGTLDPNFGVNGVARSQEIYYLDDPDSQFDWLYQKNGKFLIASNYLNLYQWNADLTPDKSFGSNGSFKLPDDSQMNSILSQGPKIYPIAKGGYLVTLTRGGYGLTDGTLQIWKTEFEGKINQNFGKNGTIIISDPSKTKGFFNAIPLSDGKVLVVGNTLTKIFLRRYLSNGQLDVDFGLNGDLDLDLNIGRYENLVPLSDASVLIYSTHSTDVDFSEILQIIKVDSNGAMDKIFKPQQYHGAKLILNIYMRKSFVERNGEVYIINEVEGSRNKSAIYKLLPDGSLDPSFLILTDIFVNDLIKSSDGSVVLLGSIDFNKTAAAERYDSNGIIDSKFGNLGRLTISSGSAEVIGRILSGSIENNKLIIYGILGSHIQDQFTPRYRIFSARIKY